MKKSKTLHSRKPSGARTLWCAVLCYIGIVAPSWTGLATPRTDRLFFLLTNEPPIIRIEYSYQLETTNEATAFIAGRQSNTFYIRDAVTSTNGPLVPKDQIFERSYEHYWAVGANLVKATPIEQADRPGETELLRKGVDNQMVRLASAMTFGVSHLSGTARKISDNGFEGESVQYGRVTGMVRETDGAIEIEYSVAQQTNRTYFVSYPRASFNPEGFPKEAIRSVQQGGKRFVLGHSRYHTLLLGVTNLLDTGGFVPSMFLLTNKPKELFVVSSNAFFAVKGNGSLIEMPKPGAATDAPLSRTSHGFLVFCSIFISLNILLATWLMFRARTKNGTIIQ